MKKFFPFLLLLIFAASCAWLFETNKPQKPGNPTPIPTIVSQNPTEVPEPNVPPTGRIYEKRFENVQVGRFHDYAIDKDSGNGYLLSLTGNSINVSIFDGQNLSVPELVTNSGPNHKLAFNKPRIVSLKDTPYVFWGPHTRRDDGIKYIKKSGNSWSSPVKLLSGRYVEFFDVERFKNTLYIVAFLLPNDGTDRGDFVIIDLNGNQYDNRKFNAKGINSYYTKNKTYFSTRFYNNFLWTLENDKISVSKRQKEFHEPLIELSDIDNNIWFHGYIFKGELPHYLAVDSGKRNNVLAELNETEAKNSSLLTSSIRLGNKVFLFYDISFNMFKGELFTSLTEEAQDIFMRDYSNIGPGFYPVSDSYKNLRGEVVFRNTNDTNNFSGTLISYSFR